MGTTPTKKHYTIKKFDKPWLDPDAVMDKLMEEYKPPLQTFIGFGSGTLHYGTSTFVASSLSTHMVGNSSGIPTYITNKTSYGT